MKSNRRQLAETIGQRTLDVVDMDSLATEVAAYLVAEQQVVEFDSLIRDIMQYRADKGVIEATVVSAYEVDKQTDADITKLLKVAYPTATAIKLNHALDPEIIGGVRIDLANEVLDLTTQSKLNKFKRLTGAGKG